MSTRIRSRLALRRVVANPNIRQPQAISAGNARISINPTNINVESVANENDATESTATKKTKKGAK